MSQICVCLQRLQDKYSIIVIQAVVTKINALNGWINLKILGNNYCPQRVDIVFVKADVFSV
jgi:hypothetical protein